MKLRIFENSLRLRLGPQEVELMISRGSLAKSIAIGPGPNGKLSYILSITDREKLESSYENNCIEIKIPESLAREWAHGDQVSISTLLEYGDSDLNVLIEKDFTCLIERKGKEDVDTFPNPHAGDRK